MTLAFSDTLIPRLLHSTTLHQRVQLVATVLLKAILLQVVSCLHCGVFSKAIALVVFCAGMSPAGLLLAVSWHTCAVKVMTIPSSVSSWWML